MSLVKRPVQKLGQMECGFVFRITSFNSTGKSSLQFHPNAQCKKIGIGVNTWQFALYIILSLLVDWLIWFCSSSFCKGARTRFWSWPYQLFASRCTCALLTATILLWWPATRSPLDGFFSHFSRGLPIGFFSINFCFLYSPGSHNSWIRKGLSRPVIL